MKQLTNPSARRPYDGATLFMIMRTLRLAALALIPLLAAISALCQDLVVVAPQAAKVEYEDARVRVVRLRIAPHESLPTHDRPRRVIIPLATSVVTSTSSNGRIGPSRSIAGQPGWGEPGMRSLVNLADPVENIVVELKNASVPAKPLSRPPTPPPAGYLNDKFYRWLSENQYVRVYEVRIPPGATTDFHLHSFDCVTVSLTAGLLTQEDGKDWTKVTPTPAGAVEFSSYQDHPVTRRVRNDGATEHHAIIVQFLEQQ